MKFKLLLEFEEKLDGTFSLFAFIYIFWREEPALPKSNNLALRF